MRHRLVRRVVYLGIFILGLLSSCTPNRAEETETRIGVRLATVRREEMPQIVPIFGSIAPRSAVDIYPEVQGRIVAAYVEEGSKVREGEPLARIDDSYLRLRMDQAISEIAAKEALVRLAQDHFLEGQREAESRLIAIDKAEREVAQRRREAVRLERVVEHQQLLYEAGGIPRETLETIRTQYEGAATVLALSEQDLAIARIGYRDQDLRAVHGEDILKDITPEERHRRLVELNVRALVARVFLAEAELRAAQSGLEEIELLVSRSVISAPLSGVVGRRYVNVGDMATPDSLLFTLFDTRTVLAEVQAGEADLPFLVQNQDAILTIPGAPRGEDFPGTLHLITPYVDPQSRSAGVKILVDNPEGLLLPGMFVEGSIVVGTPLSRLLLPGEAVSPQGTVLLYARDRVYAQNVKVEEGPGDTLLVMHGVSEGDRVVADVRGSIPSGSLVEVLQ